MTNQELLESHGAQAVGGDLIQDGKSLGLLVDGDVVLNDAGRDALAAAKAAKPAPKPKAKTKTKPAAKAETPPSEAEQPAASADAGDGAADDSLSALLGEQ